ncbi:MAG: hypothetical protein ACJ74W_10615 [Pyrinomonadaceae bacterium]
MTSSRSSGRRQRLILPACLLLLCCAAPAVRAQAPAQNDVRAPIQPGARTTYMDLIKLVLPDADFAGTGGITAHKTIEVRDLFANEAPSAYEGQLTLDGFDKLWLRDGPHTRLCLLLRLTSTDEQFVWGELHIMAVYQIAPQPRLLDAADVQADRFAEFWSAQPTLAIGPHKDAAIIANSHFNSTEGFLELTLVSIEHNRLTAVYDRAALVHTNQCGHSYQTTPTFAARKQPRGDHYSLNLRVKLQLGTDEKDCEHSRLRPATRHYQALLVWQPRQRKYIISGNGLAPLERFERNYVNQP